MIADRSWQLRRSPVGALPYFDGWCFLAAMHFLANVGAVTDDYLADPITSCAFGINPPGCPHMKLAQVPGQRSRMRYPVDWDVWHCITEIAGFAGWVVGFDANGNLQTAPQLALLTSTPYRGTFTTADIADSTDPAFLLTIRDQLSIGLDTSPRRTGISFYKSGPNDTPQIAAMLDIDDTMPGFVSTIHGFRETRTEQGNLLNDPQFAAGYAGIALARLALPQVMVEFGTYLLPAIYPLDQCDVEESVMLQGSLRINLEDISQTWSAADPSAFHARLKGRAQ